MGNLMMTFFSSKIFYFKEKGKAKNMEKHVIAAAEAFLFPLL